MASGHKKYKMQDPEIQGAYSTNGENVQFDSKNSKLYVSFKEVVPLCSRMAPIFNQVINCTVTPRYEI